MKTVIDIDDVLMKKALSATGAKTKREAVHLALEEMVKLKQRERLIGLKGSGILSLGLKDLKALRKRREVKHASLPN